MLIVSPTISLAALLAGLITFTVVFDANPPRVEASRELALDIRAASRIRDLDVLEGTLQGLSGTAWSGKLTAEDLKDRIEIRPLGDQSVAFLFGGGSALEADAIANAAVRALVQSMGPYGRQREALEVALAQDLKLLRRYLAASNETSTFLSIQTDEARSGNLPSKYIAQIVEDLERRMLFRVGELQMSALDLSRELRGAPVPILRQGGQDQSGGAEFRFQRPAVRAAGLSIIVALLVLVVGEALWGVTRAGAATRPRKGQPGELPAGARDSR